MHGISGEGMYMLARQNRSSLATGPIQKLLPTLPQYPTYFPTCEDERVRSAVTYISTSYFKMSRTGNPDNLNY